MLLSVHNDQWLPNYQGPCHIQKIFSFVKCRCKCLMLWAFPLESVNYSLKKFWAAVRINNNKMAHHNLFLKLSPVQCDVPAYLLRCCGVQKQLKKFLVFNSSERFRFLEWDSAGFWLLFSLLYNTVLTITYYNRIAWIWEIPQTQQQQQQLCGKNSSHFLLTFALIVNMVSSQNILFAFSFHEQVE